MNPQAKKAHTHESTGLFCILEDDSVLSILGFTMQIHKGVGRRLLESVKSTVRNTTSLLLTCKHFYNLLSRTCPDMLTELAARSKTAIIPRNVCDMPYPYSYQLTQEKRSEAQLKLLSKAYKAMALHCASECCSQPRKHFNRLLQKKYKTSVLLPLVERSIAVSPNETGNVVFSHTRKRVSKRTDHGMSRHASYQLRASMHFLVKMTLDRNVAREEECIEIDVVNESPPLAMLSNPSGSMIAFSSSVHEGVVQEERIAFGKLRIWNLKTVEEVTPVQDVDVPADICNPQAFWWLGDHKIAVAWSNALFHPSGAFIGSKADQNCAEFVLAWYALEDDEWTLSEWLGPYPGSLRTANASASGKEVAFVVHSSLTGGRAPKKSVLFYDSESEEMQYIDPSAVWRLDSRALSHAKDGPVAAALSPAADALLCVHLNGSSVVVEVLSRVGTSAFASLQIVDVTTFLALGCSEHHIGNPSVRRPYSISFSPCGRFAAIVDQRPFWGIPQVRYGLVVLDMLKRNDLLGIRAVPLAPIAEMATRSLSWVKTGMCIQPSYGAVMLCN